jgi:hypothetical protein
MRQVIAFVAVSLLAMIGTVSAKPFSEIHVPLGVVLSEPTPVEKFMEKIAAIETPGGGYQTVNRFGMMGRYQFSHETVKAVGINTSRQEFLNNKELQDTAMVRLMILNEKHLSDVISKFEGRTVKGVRITRASILAGAHFAGANGVRRYLTNDSLDGTIDGLGTSLRTYMRYFADFHLPPLNS